MLANCPDYDTPTGVLYLVDTSVSFAGSNPTTVLTSGNWISEGISVTQPTTMSNVGGMDTSYSFYTYLTKINGVISVGLAWYVVLACDFPDLLNPLSPKCSPPQGTTGCTTNAIQTVYCILDSNSATLPGGVKYATDTIILTLYWCTTAACKNYNGNGVGVFIFDWKDTNYSSNAYTIEDFSPPTFTAKDFYLGAAGVYPINGPNYDSLGYQLGIAASQRLSSTNWNVQITNPGYSTNYSDTIYAWPILHAQTAGAQIASAGGGGDAFWHDNWAYGGPTPWTNNLTPVESAPVDDLAASQANGQSFTSISTGRTVCAQVNNFNSLKSFFDGFGLGKYALGYIIATHPADDNLGYWTIIGTYACSWNPTTWVYAKGYLVPDTTALW